MWLLFVKSKSTFFEGWATKHHMALSTSITEGSKATTNVSLEHM